MYLNFNKPQIRLACKVGYIWNHKRETNMDPALRKEKEAFKRKALAAAEKSQKSREAAAKAKESFQPTQAKKPKKKQAQASESVGTLL